MNINLKNTFSAVTLALAASSTFAQTVGSTLGDLKAVTAIFDQTTLDAAARTLLDASLTAAYAGTYAPVALNPDEAVIFQTGTDGFAYIGQEQNALAPSNNYASIDQVAASVKAYAYIVQTGTGNYASVTQATVLPALAYISQTSSGNKAIIDQK